MQPIASQSPTVALESTVISHGLPYPHNLRLALRLEEIVREGGATPATVGIIAGEIVVGLSHAQIEHLATAPNVRKVSRRDLPIVVARKLDGATTVATTAWAAHRAGIQVFATGGIGGVHRTESNSEFRFQPPICFSPPISPPTSPSSPRRPSSSSAQGPRRSWICRRRWSGWRRMA